MRIQTILIITLIITIAAVAALGVFFFIYLNGNGAAAGYLPFILEFLKIIVIGFFVALASILIPNLFHERKYEFEMRKEAKKAYTESFTGVSYLNTGLPYMKSAEEAFRHLEELHRKKHLAETYYEYLDTKNRNAEFIQWRIWPENSDPGKAIEEAKAKVMKLAHNWNELAEKERFDYFNSTKNRAG